MKYQRLAPESGPLMVYGPAFQEHMEAQGYAPDSVDWRLRQLAVLDRLLHEHGLAANALDEACVDRLEASRRAAHRKPFIAAANLRLTVVFPWSRCGAR